MGTATAGPCGIWSPAMSMRGVRARTSGVESVATVLPVRVTPCRRKV